MEGTWQNSCAGEDPQSFGDRDQARLDQHIIYPVEFPEQVGQRHARLYLEHRGQCPDPEREFREDRAASDSIGDLAGEVDRDRRRPAPAHRPGHGKYVPIDGCMADLGADHFQGFLEIIVIKGERHHLGRAGTVQLQELGDRIRILEQRQDRPIPEVVAQITDVDDVGIQAAWHDEEARPLPGIAKTLDRQVGRRELALDFRLCVR